MLALTNITNLAHGYATIQVADILLLQLCALDKFPQPAGASQQLSQLSATPAACSHGSIWRRLAQQLLLLLEEADAAQPTLTAHDAGRTTPEPSQGGKFQRNFLRPKHHWDPPP